jgi:large subunit ribosomal protein L7/L12
MDDAQLAERLAVLEQQVKLLSDQLGVECPPFPGAVEVDAVATPSALGDVPDDVVALARAGHTDKAISMLRMMTGITKSEAREIVDNL